MKKLGPFQTSNFTCARASARIPILTWLAHTTQVLWVLKSLGIYNDYGKNTGLSSDTRHIFSVFQTPIELYCG